MKTAVEKLGGGVNVEELLSLVDPLSAMSAGVELFAAVIAAMLLIACTMEGSSRQSSGRYIMAILAVHVVLLTCDAAVWLMDGVPGWETLEVVLVMLVDLLGYLALALFTLFSAEYIGRFAPVPSWVRGVAVWSCSGMAALWAGSTLGGGLAYQFGEGGYEEGLLYWVGTIFAVGILLFNLGLVVRYRKELERRATVALSLYSILPLMGYAFEPVWSITAIYLGSTAALVLCYTVVHVDQTRLLAQRERDLAESRVAIAVSQIQPHFLFNALNTICYLCGVDAKEAQVALREFSAYLRMNIDSIGVNKPTFFLAELDHVKTYLKLEKLRFEDELNVEYDIQATDFKVPPLSVQPLVENAVKHGVGKKLGGGTVRLSTRELENCFEIIVQDDGVGFDPSVQPDDGREHVGISNVRQRLWSMCNASVDVASEPGAGTTVTVRIPKEGNQA